MFLYFALPVVQVQSFHKNATQSVTFPQMPPKSMDWVTKDIDTIRVDKKTFDDMAGL